jgi:hypothetical protein
MTIRCTGALLAIILATTWTSAQTYTVTDIGVSHPCKKRPDRALSLDGTHVKQTLQSGER